MPAAALAARWSLKALDAGHEVRAYVRNPAKLDLAHPNLTVLTGEYEPATALFQAFGPEPPKGGGEPEKPLSPAAFPIAGAGFEPATFGL